MTAREIAKDFISKMNPSRWAGVGQKPDPAMTDGE